MTTTAAPAERAARAAALELLQDVPEPTLEAIHAARLAARHTQAQAAACAGLSHPVQWSHWETGFRSPDAARWALYLLATGQHPHARATRRREKATAPATPTGVEKPAAPSICA